ncbi:MAG TPA: acyl-CoA carboxylase subunit epsilon [Frankiaceae bacterium]|nr:acyl-CoA carboxylase subunit epsilon [Frankiaceae bacterium]
MGESVSSEEPRVEAAPEPERPVLRIVKGDATPEEIAALVAVLTARAAAAVEAPKAQASPWIHRRAQLSKPVFVGAGEWQRSGFDKGTRTKADW